MRPKKARALLPILRRNIVVDGKDSGYFDVVSPYGCNGPLFVKDVTESDITAFWAAVDAWYVDHNVVSEFIRFNFNTNHQFYSGVSQHTLSCVRGTITSWETFWSNLKGKTRNQFRKAEKLGLRFEMSHDSISKDKIEAFYELYIGTMNRRQAEHSFYYDLEYFMDFCRKHPGQVAIGLVYLDETPISGEFFLFSEDTMYSYLAGTDAAYFKLRPTEFLKISAIAWAQKAGYTYYLIGGGRADGDNLYLYKKKYFPLDEDVPFYTGRKILDNDVYRSLAKAEGHQVEDVDILEGFFPLYRQTVDAEV